MTFGAFWWWILACCWKSPSLSYFQFELKSFWFVYLFKLMTQIRCTDFGCCWSVLCDLFSHFLQKWVLTVHTLLLFFAKLFRSQKSQTIQRKPSLLPFLMARMRTYEKSLRIFLPKLFPPIMQVGKMVNAAVWWHPNPTCCQVNELFSALTVTFISLLTCLSSLLPISSFWWNFLNDFFNSVI